MCYGLELLWKAVRADYVGKISMALSDVLFLHDSPFFITVYKKRLNNNSSRFFFIVDSALTGRIKYC